MRFEVKLKGETYFVEVEKCSPITENDFALFGGNQGKSTPVESQIEIAPQKTSSDGNTINAPLPGSIVAIKVAVGQSVKKGQVVALLEAMKMENEIVSPDDGIIKTILAPKGSNVVVGDPIIELG
ncbi:MAG: biotin/lipoyl-binding protein [Clostridia bacterium]|nr:biotin/lipoyl-binding protein [Clostridia bacterium]